MRTRTRGRALAPGGSRQHRSGTRRARHGGHRPGRSRRRGTRSTVRRACDDGRRTSAASARRRRDTRRESRRSRCCERAGARDVGVPLTLEKRLPLSGGQGGSAASAVAGARRRERATRQSARRDRAVRVRARRRGTRRGTARRQPRAGAVRRRSPRAFARAARHRPLPVPACAARRARASRASRSDTATRAPSCRDSSIARRRIAQMANVATMVAAFAERRVALLRGALDDQIAEPARAPLLPGFADAKAAALDAGALAGSISGGGPVGVRARRRRRRPPPRPLAAMLARVSRRTASRPIGRVARWTSAAARRVLTARGRDLSVRGAASSVRDSCGAETSELDRRGRVPSVRRAPRARPRGRRDGGERCSRCSRSRMG